MLAFRPTSGAMLIEAPLLEFERAMIAERVRAGLARARSEGKRLGRPPIAPALEKRIPQAPGDSWEARCTGHCQTVWSRSSNDPVRNGLATSLNRPGGNATGVNVFLQELEGKRLGLLREIVSPGSLIAVLFNPQLAGDDQRKDIDEAARTLGQPIRVLNASSEQDIHAAFKTLGSPKPGGLLVCSNPFFNSRRE